MYISISGFLIMECISSQQYLSYSPAWRRAGSGEPASRASVSALAAAPIHRVARPQHNSYTHRESNQ